jgi:predicted enzyme related to lactoylglutathione lyase
MLRVVHFEIHASDVERASKFYNDLFGWEIKEWKFPEGAQIKDENRYWTVNTSKDQSGKWPGISGGMVIRKGPVPSAQSPMNAYVCTIDVPNIDEYLKKGEEAGGMVVFPKMPIPDIGWLAYMKDTEGNVFGMMQNL